MTPPLARPTLVMIALLLASWAATAAGQDRSVRPGINGSYENPDVPTFRERFEAEGRDVYDHRHAIVKACRLRPGMAVADIGAGTGLFTRLFSPRVGPDGKVYAVDIAENFVAHIQRTAAAEGLTNVTGVVCSQDSVRLAPRSIDLAFVCDTYHHFEYPQKTLASIRRALRPGGQLILIDFRRVEGSSPEWVLEHVRAGQEVFVAEILSAGFRQVEEVPGLLDHSYFIRFEKPNGPP